MKEFQVQLYPNLAFQHAVVVYNINLQNIRSEKTYELEQETLRAREASSAYLLCSLSASDFYFRVSLVS